MERLLVWSLAVVLVVLRSAVLVLSETAQYDSDQALIGLMAKHLAEGRAFPVFAYGQDYMLGVEAWMAAPLFLLGGATVTMLKLPLLIVNAAIAVVLIWSLERHLGLRPAIGLVPALFFVLPPPGTTVLLLDTSGGNVEPFLIVLLVWAIRARPVLCGAVIAFGFLHREFAIYALGALILLRIADRSLFARSAWQYALRGFIGFAAMWQTIYLLKQYSAVWGPGTSIASVPVPIGANVYQITARVCLDAARIPEIVLATFRSYLPTLFGANHRPMADYGINSLVAQGVEWMWPLLGGMFLVAGARVGWNASRGAPGQFRASVEFPFYLLLVGVQAVAFHALLRCGDLAASNMRYSVLGLLAGVGLTAAFLRVEPRRHLKTAAATVVLLWAAVSFSDHLRLIDEYIYREPANGRRIMASYLMSRGIRFAYGSYWDAHTVSFLSGEHVIVASTNSVFLHEYQWLVDARRDEAVWIRQEPCEGGTAVLDRYYVCPPETR